MDCTKKYIEIRDDGTFIPAFAIAINGEDHYLARRAGYGRRNYILLVKLCGPEAQYNWSKWGNSRTMTTAHKYLNENWDTVKNGDVVDVQFILGEVPSPCLSESFAGF